MKRWIVGFLYVLQACSGDAAPTRSGVLQSLVKQVAVPEARRLTDMQHTLTTSLVELERAPSEAALATVRSAWQPAALAWVRMEALRMPVNDDGRSSLRAAFWPTRSSQLEELLQDSAALGPEQIDELGVDVRGMYALEWLIFTEPTTRILTVSARGARTRTLARALAQNVEQYALELAHTIGTGDRWADALVQDDAASLSRLVNITTAAVEQLASDRLGPALARRAVSSRELRGGYSGSSSELVQTQFAMVERLYLGEQSRPGIAALIKPAAPTIEQHLRTLFQTAHARLHELDRPLDQLAQLQRPRIVNAQTALKELERALKTEASSALGVTLTFESSDGD